MGSNPTSGAIIFSFDKTTYFHLLMCHIIKRELESYLVRVYKAKYSPAITEYPELSVLDTSFECLSQIALHKFIFLQKVSADIVPDRDLLQQIGLYKRCSMQGSVTTREYFETNHKNKKGPNVGLEPTTLRLRVSCSTD